MKRKWLVVGIILLFVGVSIAPTINFNVVKASQDDDLVEVTTQACGIKGYGDTTVKLTRQQYQNLEQYLVDFRARLNQTSTREEAVPIFKEAVVELDRYGLLPNGMSVERAQKLVTGWNQNRNEKLLDNRQREIFPLIPNIFCLIYGSVTEEPYVFPIIIIGPFMFIESFLIWLLVKLGVPEDNIIIFFLFFDTYNPLRFMSLVMISNLLDTNLYSFGLRGAVYLNSGGLGLYFLGYTGLTLIRSYGEKSYFLGSALAVVY